MAAAAAVAAAVPIQTGCLLWRSHRWMDALDRCIAGQKAEKKEKERQLGAIAPSSC